MLLKNKNTTPRLLSVYTALVLSLVLSLCGLILRFDLLSFVISFIVSFIICYVIINYVISQFIYRKIKLIYKFILETKANKIEKTQNKWLFKRKGLDDIESDVRNWAVEKRVEIQNMEKNEQFRKEFLLNLSHELRTPVFAVQGYIHTLLDGAIDDKKVREKFLHNATKNTDRLAQLIEDLSVISKLESGELPLNKEPFNIQELIKDTFDALSIKANSKNISFLIKKGCENPVKIFADKEKIRQVIINLLDNSVKYGKQGGHTKAGIYNMDDETALIEISDNGIGIEEEQLPRVFERFYRVDKARSRAEGGTGLGLAIVKHIIEAHGQNINVRSKPNIGTTFGFTMQIGKK